MLRLGTPADVLVPDSTLMFLHSLVFVDDYVVKGCPNIIDNLTALILLVMLSNSDLGGRHGVY
jgi:hypothetical protein